MKIAIPTSGGKLCSHFGKCDSFTFAEVDLENNKIINIESRIPEDGISCQSASWIAEQGADVVLAGGMGGRPMDIFYRNGVTVISGCPELEVSELVESFLNKVLITGENTCGGEHHHCHHGDGGHCHGHHS